MKTKIKIVKMGMMKKRDFLSLAILACFFIIFFYPVLVQQKTFITTGLIQSDLMNFNYPLKSAYGDALKKGELLLWTPLIGNGFPVFAEGQIGGLYPLNLLLFKFLPNLQAFNYSLLIHYFLAGLTTFFFVKKILKLSPISGLVAGVTYSLSGFFMAHLVHPSMIQVASFIPLNFLLVEKIIQGAGCSSQIAGSRRSNMPSATRYVLALAFTFALQALAGHHELLYFTVIFSFFYLLLRCLITWRGQFPRPLLSSFISFSLSGLLALILSAVQILPTWELVKNSTRMEGVIFKEATGYIYPLSHFLTFITPRRFDFAQTIDYASVFPDAINVWETYGYVGIIPLILTLTAIILFLKQMATSNEAKATNTRSKLLTSYTFTFTILLIFSILLVLGRSTPVFKILWFAIPGMKLFKNPTRFLVFTEFFLAILAAIGFEKLEFRVCRRRCLLRAPSPKLWSVGDRSGCEGRAIALATERSLEPRIRKFLSKKLTSYTLYSILYTLILIVFFDLFIHNRPLNPTIDPKIWFPPPETAQFLAQNLGPYRYHTLGTSQFDYSLINDATAQIDLKSFLPANFNMLFDLPTNEFLAGLLLDRHTKLNRQAPEAVLTFASDKKSFVPPVNWVKLLSLQAVKFIVSPLPLEHFALKLKKEIPLSSPREFNLYFLKEGKPNILKITTQTAYIYENTMVLPLTFFVPKASVVSKISDEELLKILLDPSFNPQETVLLEETPPENEGFYVFSETFYPGFKAYVNGRETKIYRANFAFRAIPVNNAKDEVKIFYKPGSFRIGLIVSLGGAILVGFYFLFGEKIKIKLFP